MWIKQLLMGIAGLAGGFTVSAGVFGFIIVLGVIPRICGMTHTAKNAMLYENTIFLGGMFGNLMSIFDISLEWIFPMPMGIQFAMHTGFLGLYGLCAGTYVGCMAISLAEMLNAFPIMFRRSRMKMGLGFILISVAVGKVIGSLYYYANHMAAQ